MVGAGTKELRPACLARGRRLAGRTLGLTAGLRLRSTRVALATNALRRLAEALAQSLRRLGRFLLAFFRRFGSRGVLAANQLDLRALRGVAAPEADAQDARVAARPFGKSRR